MLRCCNQSLQVFSSESLKLIYSCSGASSPKGFKRKGRDGNGREGKGREGKGREGTIHNYTPNLVLDLIPDLKYYKTMYMLPKKCFVSLGQSPVNEHCVLLRDLSNGNILQTMVKIVLSYHIILSYHLILSLYLIIIFLSYLILSYLI